MIPNFKTDAKMLAKTLLQIFWILLVFFVLFCGLFSYIVDDNVFKVGPPPAATESAIDEGTAPPETPDLLSCTALPLLF